MATERFPLPVMRRAAGEIAPLLTWVPPIAAPRPIETLADYVAAWFAEAQAQVFDQITSRCVELCLPDSTATTLHLIAVSTNLNLAQVNVAALGAPRAFPGEPPSIWDAITEADSLCSTQLGPQGAPHGVYVAVNAMKSPVGLMFRLACGHIVVMPACLATLSVDLIADMAIAATASHAHQVAAIKPHGEHPEALPDEAWGSDMLAAILDPSAVTIMGSREEVRAAIASFRATGRFVGGGIAAVDSSAPGFTALDTELRAAMAAPSQFSAHPHSPAPDARPSHGDNFGPAPEDVAAALRKLH
jgi:hypothetical protein